MSTKRLSNASKWLELVSLYEEGGESLIEFCKKHSIKKETFYYWRRKSKALKSEEERIGFVNIHPVGERKEREVIRVRYKNGTELELPLGYELSSLSYLLKLDLC